MQIQTGLVNYVPANFGSVGGGTRVKTGMNLGALNIDEVKLSGCRCQPAPPSLSGTSPLDAGVYFCFRILITCRILREKRKAEPGALPSYSIGTSSREFVFGALIFNWFALLG